MSDIFNHEADAWDSLIYDDEPTNYPPKKFKCKRCGEGGLSWKKLSEGWRTHKYNSKTCKLEIHKCSFNVTPANWNGE